jgi:hypothetical protein
MTSIILLTTCRIAGEHCEASNDPIEVSEENAKYLIAMKYAKPVKPAKAAQPVKAKPPSISSEP